MVGCPWLARVGRGERNSKQHDTQQEAYEFSSTIASTAFRYCYCTFADVALLLRLHFDHCSGYRPLPSLNGRRLRSGCLCHHRRRVAQLLAVYGILKCRARIPLQLLVVSSRPLEVELHCDRKINDKCQSAQHAVVEIADACICLRPACRVLLLLHCLRSVGTKSRRVSNFWLALAQTICAINGLTSGFIASRGESAILTLHL